MVTRIQPSSLCKSRYTFPMKSQGKNYTFPTISTPENYTFPIKSSPENYTFPTTDRKIQAPGSTTKPPRGLRAGKNQAPRLCLCGIITTFA